MSSKSRPYHPRFPFVLYVDEIQRVCRDDMKVYGAGCSYSQNENQLEIGAEQSVRENSSKAKDIIVYGVESCFLLPEVVKSRDIPTPYPAYRLRTNQKRPTSHSGAAREPARCPADSAALHVAFPRAWQEVERASQTCRDFESTIAILGSLCHPVESYLTPRRSGNSVISHI